LNEIEAYVQQLDDAYNMNIVTKLYTKSSDSTEVTLEMRKILVKWILQVAEKFKANQETVHISIQIIDYILVFSHKKITKTNFQLLGISSLFVASKYNEIYTPEAKKYVYVCDGLYTLEDLFGMESYILTLTSFNL
jgi:cyclin B